MGLEIQTNKTPGDTIRTTPAERPAFIGLCIVALTLIEFVLMFLVFDAIFKGANLASEMDPAIKASFMGSVLKSEQQVISLWLAGIFFNLSFIVFLYQRFFMDHVTIAKRRFRKWEDEGVQL